MLRVNSERDIDITTPYSSLDEFQPEPKKMRLDNGYLTEDSFNKVEIIFGKTVPVLVAGNNIIQSISSSPWQQELSFKGTLFSSTEIKIDDTEEENWEKELSLPSFNGTLFSSTEIEIDDTEGENWEDAYNILEENADPAPLLAFIKKGGNLLDEDDLEKIVALADTEYPEVIFALCQYYPDVMLNSSELTKGAFIPENSELIEALLKNDPNMDWKKYCYTEMHKLNPIYWIWVKEPLLGLINEYGETLSSQEKKVYAEYCSSRLAEQEEDWGVGCDMLIKRSDPKLLLALIKKEGLETLDDKDLKEIIQAAIYQNPEIAFECCKHLSPEYIDALAYNKWSSIFIEQNLALIESLLANDHHMAWKKWLHGNITSHPEDWQWLPKHLLKIIYDCEEKIILEDNTYQNLKSALDAYGSAKTENVLGNVKRLLENEPKINMFDLYEWNSYFSGLNWQELDPRIADEIDAYIKRKVDAKNLWERSLKQELANESIDLGFTYEDRLFDHNRIDTLNMAILGNNAHRVKIALNMPECHDTQQWKKTVFKHFISNPSPQIKKLLQCHLQKHLRYCEDPSDLV